MFIFKNHTNENIPRSGVINQGTINHNELCYQCSKDGTECLLGKFSIRDSRNEPHFPEKIKSLSSQIQMNTLFENNDERKRSICDRNIHKAMQIPVNIIKKNKISLLHFNQKTHVNFNFQNVYGYHSLIKLSTKL